MIEGYDSEINDEDLDDDSYNEADFEQLEDEPKDDDLGDFLPGDDEILKLTEYDGGLDVGNSNTGISINAEYHDISTTAIEKRHGIVAKNFVTKITKFIFDFKDVELTDAHKSYIKSVATMQLENLVDLMTLTTINKQMLDNIVRRVNSVQAEDYAMIATYNNLVMQHMKLIKELQNTYKAIPGVLKKMRTEVLCNQELGDVVPAAEAESTLTGDFGTTHFNNTKQMLKALKERQENKQ